MTEKNKTGNTDLDTKVYTLQVNLTVQVLAENQKDALERLDANGGYVTKRDVSVVKEVPLKATLSAVE
jgi:hypothetical protein